MKVLRECACGAAFWKASDQPYHDFCGPCTGELIRGAIGAEGGGVSIRFGELRVVNECVVCGEKQLARRLCADGQWRCFPCEEKRVTYWAPVAERDAVSNPENPHPCAMCGRWQTALERALAERDAEDNAKSEQTAIALQSYAESVERLTRENALLRLALSDLKRPQPSARRTIAQMVHADVERHIANVSSRLEERERRPPSWRERFNDWALDSTPAFYIFAVAPIVVIGSLFRHIPALVEAFR